MRSRWIWGLLVLASACKAEIGGGNFGADGSVDGANVAGDATAIDAPAPLPAWGAPRLVPGASTATPEDDGTLTTDSLEMVFALADPADAGRKHLYYIKRDTAASTTWSAPLRLSINVNLTTDQTPRFSDDGKTLYFASNRPGTTGGLDIYQATRATLGSTTFNPPTLVAGVNSASADKWCMPCSGNRYLLISSRAPSTSEDLYEGTLGGGAPTLVAELSSASGETGAFLSKDCLTAYFASTRSGTNKIYTSTRASVTSPWSPPTEVADFAALGGDQEDPWVSDDNRTFLLSSNSAGNKDVYISTR
ncbi:MAG: PD40 domain-containing protein [Deltaproteobacteria bacterium]|nr:PD40 domain-containing protein [Deltaproteobacteria bacterium]MDQ3295404.1 hypothetical protein [Myxococcota bacterium]